MIIQNGAGRLISCVIWDFNGTLINDVQTAVHSVNDTLKKVGLPLTNVEEYRRNMDMPIIRYYEKHFDLSRVSFDFLSKEYHDGFERYSHLLCPGKGAQEAVKLLYERGVRQCVISSFEQQKLLSLLDRFGFLPYLDGVCGAEGNECLSKIDRGCLFIKKQGIKPENALVVGDLSHDCDLARALNAPCLLFSGGHQDKERLLKCGVKVIDDLMEVLDYE